MSQRARAWNEGSLGDDGKLAAGAVRDTILSDQGGKVLRPPLRWAFFEYYNHQTDENSSNQCIAHLLHVSIFSSKQMV